MTLLYTFIATLVLITLALFGMTISWFVKKKALKKGTCGFDPNLQRDESCGVDKQKDCPLCSGSKTKE